MDEQQSKTEGPVGEESAPLLNEFNQFWSSLARIVSDFESDVTQIKLHLQDAVVKMPTEHDERFAKSASELVKINSLTDGKGEDEIITFVSEDDTTRVINKRDLSAVADLSQRFLIKHERNKNFLKIISFNHLVSLFDGAMLDFAKEFFKKSPTSMVPRDKGATIPTLNYTEILGSRSIDHLQEIIVERELFNFGYKSIRQQIQQLNKMLNSFQHPMYKLNSPILVDEHLIGSVIEIRETKNIHVHNRGIINQQYQNKIQEYLNEVNSKVKDSTKHIFISTLKLGDFKETTDRYLEDSIWKLTHLLNAIRTAFNEKFLSPDELAKLEKNNMDYWNRRQEVADSVIPDKPTTEEPNK